MVWIRTGWVLTMMLMVAFSGCTDADDDDATLDDTVEACAGDGFCGQDAVVDEVGRDLRTGLTADDTLDAPTWRVGDVFEQHMFFGKEDTAGSHIQTMVVDDSGGCYQVATSDTDAAKNEATYDYPILGCIGKEDLQTTAFGTDWSWMYAFPLSDGQSWNAEIEGMINWNTYSFRDFDVTFTVAYDDAIDTPKGDFPGFWITGETADGETLLYYNYVPAVGWFSHFWIYDLDSEDDPDDIMFHSMSMGTWKGYTGEYYLDESETVVDRFVGLGPDPSLIGTETAPTPVDFEVPESTYMIGVVVPIAALGRVDVSFVEPDQEVRQYSHEGSDPDGADSFSVAFVDEPAEPGAWTLQTTGASPFFWGSYVWLEAVTEMAYELTEADLPAEEA